MNDTATPKSWIISQETTAKNEQNVASFFFRIAVVNRQSSTIDSKQINVDFTAQYALHTWKPPGSNSSSLGWAYLPICVSHLDCHPDSL